MRPRCSEPSCKCHRAAVVKGLCRQHYARIVRGLKITGPIHTQKHRARPEGASRPGGPCGVDGCAIPSAAMGLCWGHYQAQRRGQPLGGPKVKPDGAKYARAVREGPKNAPWRVRRFALLEWYLREGLVTPEPNTGCLLWLGNYNPVTGYAALGHDAGHRSTRDPWGCTGHRAALYFSGVKLEHRNRKLHARHTCNNPGCVAAAFNAPVSAHVVYGTAKENMADRTRRYERGELNRSKLGGARGPRKLSPSLVAYVVEAHARGASFAELGRDLGVQYVTVANAIRWAASTNPPAPSRSAA